MRSSGRATPVRCAAVATAPSGNVPKSAKKYKTFISIYVRFPAQIRGSDKVVLGGGDDLDTVLVTVCTVSQISVQRWVSMPYSLESIPLGRRLPSTSECARISPRARLER